MIRHREKTKKQGWGGDQECGVLCVGVLAKSQRRQESRLIGSANGVA